MQDRDDPWYTGIRRYRERDIHRERERERERERKIERGWVCVRENIVIIATDLSIGTFLKCLLKVGT